MVTKEDGYPLPVFLGCCTLVVLSREHKCLLMETLYGVLLTGCKFVPGYRSWFGEDAAGWWMVGGVIAFSCCLFVVLVQFERIDGLMQLCADVDRLRCQKERVEASRDEMNTFWTTVQNQVDLWLHRTAPRLELLKEMHTVLEGAKPEEVASLLDMVQPRLERLEEAVGDVRTWKESGPENQRAVGEAIRAAARGAEMHALLANLDSALADAIPRALEDHGNHGR